MNTWAHSLSGPGATESGHPGSIELSAQRGAPFDPGEAELRLETPFLDTTVEWQGVAHYNDSNAPLPLSPSQRKRLIVRSASKFALLLFGSFVVLAFMLWLLLPTVEGQDRGALRIPLSIEQLHALFSVLQKYTSNHYARTMFAWICILLFLQAFSIPGSMYMSILASALWGIPVALPLVCTVVATGSTLCYLLSSMAGECIKAVPQWDARVRKWQEAVAEHRHNLLSYLVLVRMTPIPHFVVNLVCPHLGVPIGIFWLSALLGVLPQAVIHVAVGEKLDEMVLQENVRIFTLHNVLLIALVVVAATAPMILRYLFSTTPPDAAHGPIHLDNRPSLIDRAVNIVYPRWQRRQPRGVFDEDAPPLDESAGAWRDLA